MDTPKHRSELSLLAHTVFTLEDYRRPVTKGWAMSSLTELPNTGGPGTGQLQAGLMYRGLLTLSNKSVLSDYCNELGFQTSAFYCTSFINLIHRHCVVQICK